MTETYGIVQNLPEQTVFNPRRSLWTDRVPPSDLVLTCAITIPKRDPRCDLPLPAQNLVAADPTPAPSSSPSASPSTDDGRPPTSGLGPISSGFHRLSSPASLWSAATLAALEPGETFTLRMDSDLHRRILCQWLRCTDTLLGMNLQFDIQYLRQYDRRFAFLLEGWHHTIIDLSCVNYLHSEVRPEKSLKTIGPVLRSYSYDPETKGKKYKDREDPALYSYNAQDSHNTILAISELARRVLQDFPHTDKLSARCIDFYSSNIWSCIRKSEAGIPMDVDHLIALEERGARHIARCLSICGAHDLLLEGKGSQLSKDAFLHRIVKEIDDASGYTAHSQLPAAGIDQDPTPPSQAPLASAPRSVLDHPLLVYTEKTRKLSWSEENRNLLFSLLPRSSPSRRLFKLARHHSHDQKIASSYLFPLLRHRRNHPNDRSSTLIPQEPLQWLSKSVSACSTPPPTDTESPTPAAPSTLALTSSSTPSATQPLLFSSPDPSPSPAPISEPPSSSWPRPVGVWLAHPTWYPVPTSAKDEGGDYGGTQQGRVVCKKPAAQTFPPEIQATISSRFPSGLIVGADMSQIELRVAALLSGDSSMVAAYAVPGRDLHTERAISIFGADFLIGKYGPDYLKNRTFLKDTRGERQVAKHVNFGDLFRSGAQTLQRVVLEMTGQLWPLRIFENIVHTRASVRPGLWAWQEELIATARKLGHLPLPIFGQSRFFMGGSKFDVNEIVNFPVQTTAGNLLIRLEAFLHRRLPDLNLRSPILPFLNVYDALKFDCRTRDDAHFLLRLLQDGLDWLLREDYWGHLQTMLGRRVPLVMEVQIPDEKTHVLTAREQ